MVYKNGNYAAFYVAEPFSESNLGALAAKDFVYYNTLKLWKANDATFPFINSHDKTYNVRDSSDWETLKTRLHERLRKSKNIILFLSSNTKNSRALREEIDYGINTLGLPVIVVYPDYSSNFSISDANKPNFRAQELWDKLPIFRDSMNKVPTVHVPMNKEYITKALKDTDFTIQNKHSNFCWCYK